MWQGWARAKSKALADRKHSCMGSLGSTPSPAWTRSLSCQRGRGQHSKGWVGGASRHRAAQFPPAASSGVEQSSCFPRGPLPASPAQALTPGEAQWARHTLGHADTLPPCWGAGCTSLQLEGRATCPCQGLVQHRPMQQQGETPRHGVTLCEPGPGAAPSTPWHGPALQPQPGGKPILQRCNLSAAAKPARTKGRV